MFTKKTFTNGPRSSKFSPSKVSRYTVAGNFRMVPRFVFFADRSATAKKKKRTAKFWVVSTVRIQWWSRARKSKPQKFLWSGWPEISRNFASAKISRDTVWIYYCSYFRTATTRFRLTGMCLGWSEWWYLLAKVVCKIASKVYSISTPFMLRWWCKTSLSGGWADHHRPVWKHPCYRH